MTVIKEITVSGIFMKLIPRTLIAVSLLILATQAYAKDNYCGECHTAREMAGFGNVMGWDRSIYQEKGTLCPGVMELKKEAYFTESRLAKYNLFLTELEENTRRYPEYIREDLVKDGVQYHELATVNPTSIGGITGPNLKIKKKINEVYTTLNKLRDDYTMEKVIGIGLVLVMLLTLLLSLGLKNTLKE